MVANLVECRVMRDAWWASGDGLCLVAIGQRIVDIW